jgi:hypothetical protein
MPLFKLKYWLLAGMLLPVALLALSLVNPDGPDYSVTERADDFEIRRYAPMNVAETRVAAGLEEADDLAYPPLLDYVGGRNSLSRKVPMLAPAMQQQTNDGEWLVRFVMAQEYPMAMLPPTGTDAVSLVQIPERSMAVARFSGGWAEARWREQIDALRRAIERAGMDVVGEPVLARYNAPFVPGFLRRNEVLWEIEP